MKVHGAAWVACGALSAYNSYKGTQRKEVNQGIGDRPFTLTPRCACTAAQVVLCDWACITAACCAAVPYWP